MGMHVRIHRIHAVNLQNFSKSRSYGLNVPYKIITVCDSMLQYVTALTSIYEVNKTNYYQTMEIFCLKLKFVFAGCDTETIQLLLIYYLSVASSMRLTVELYCITNVQ